MGIASLCHTNICAVIAVVKGGVYTKLTAFYIYREIIHISKYIPFNEFITAKLPFNTYTQLFMSIYRSYSVPGLFKGGKLRILNSSPDRFTLNPVHAVCIVYIFKTRYAARCFVIFCFKNTFHFICSRQSLHSYCINIYKSEHL